MNETRKIRSDYGTLPNKSDFDPKWWEKRNRAAFNNHNKFSPLSNVEHFVWAALENIMVYWCLRGCREPSLLMVDDFDQGIVDKGEFKGIAYVRLKENYHGQKNNDLTLKKCVKDAENTRKKTLPCMFDEHPLSCYQTTTKLLGMVPDSATITDGIQRIFQKPASKTTMDKWIIKGKTWRLNPSGLKVIGEHTINQILKKVATLCNYNHPTRCTAHGKRRCGISQVANGGASAAVSKMVGGHAKLETTAIYQKPNQAAFDQVSRMKHGSPSKIQKVQMDAQKKIFTYPLYVLFSFRRQ